MSAVICPCGAVLKKPGITGLCRVCVVKRPKSAATREKMRSAAIVRESDPEFRARRQAAATAGVARFLSDPAARAQRSAWGRVLGRRNRGNLDHGPKGSPKRMAIGRKVSATKLGWCPMEYRQTYRDLMAGKQHTAAEVRAMIADLIAADQRRFLVRGVLPQAERAGK